MKQIDLVIWREGDAFVAQCLNVDVSSFGETREEAIDNLKEAVELYFQDETVEMTVIESVSICKETINA